MYSCGPSPRQAQTTSWLPRDHGSLKKGRVRALLQPIDQRQSSIYHLSTEQFKLTPTEAVRDSHSQEDQREIEGLAEQRVGSLAPHCAAL